MRKKNLEEKLIHEFNKYLEIKNISIPKVCEEIRFHKSKSNTEMAKFAPLTVYNGTRGETSMMASNWSLIFDHMIRNGYKPKITFE